MRDPRMHRCVARTIAVLLLDFIRNRTFLIYPGRGADVEETEGMSTKTGERGDLLILETSN